MLSGENSRLLEKLVAENFDQSSTAFIDVLCGVLASPVANRRVLAFHFLLGSIYYTAAGPHRISAFSNGRCNPANTEDVIKELVPFAARAAGSRRRSRNGPRASCGEHRKGLIFEHHR